MSQLWIVMMPEGWKPGTCVCDKCFGNCVRTDDCPLDNAKKAVEVKQPRYNGERVWSLPCSPVTLYAVKDKP